MSPVASLEEGVDGTGNARVQSGEVFYSSKHFVIKARTLGMQQGPGVYTHPFFVLFKMI